MRKIIAFFAFSALMPCVSYANIASSEYVDEKIETTSKYVDEKVETTVKTAGDQTVDGTKTYTASPIVPTPPLPE